MRNAAIRTYRIRIYTLVALVLLVLVFLSCQAERTISYICSFSFSLPWVSCGDLNVYSKWQSTKNVPTCGVQHTRIYGYTTSRMNKKGVCRSSYTTHV